MLGQQRAKVIRDRQQPRAVATGDGDHSAARQHEVGLSE
jgi:hypothetical protein